MQPRAEFFAHRFLTSLWLRSVFALATLLPCSTAVVNGQTLSEISDPTPPIHVTHILGFENSRRNAHGELSIQSDEVSFRVNGSSPAQISISSIQNIFVGEQDKQVGGMPMMMGKAAVPYGGGRVVSLFSHRKYDSLAVEYRDNRSGVHAAVFRLAKGQGQTLKDALIAHGAHLDQPDAVTPIQSTPEFSVAPQKWSVQVDRVDPGITALDPCFSSAIYEDLLRDLPKSNRFKEVLRRGDRSDSSAVLLLKTHVEHYAPGSETRRAVTTVTGATKIKVHIELVTSDGHVVLERTVEGNVRFMGDNLNATGKVANKTAKLLRKSTLPTPTSLIQQATAKEAATT